MSDIAPNAAFPFHLFWTSFQVMRFEITLSHRRHKDRGIGEKVIHLFKRTLLSLRQDGPKENSVREVTNLKLSY
jgi:hypothetical protein